MVLSNILKYFVSVCLIIAGFYGFYIAGYKNGQQKTKIEYVEKQVEIIKYVEEKKDEKQKKVQKIYAKPNADYSGVVKWLRESGTAYKH